MINTIIFDIGNVLADFSWEPFFRSFGFSEEVFQKLAQATVRSPEWNELDRGVWTTEEIIQAFIKNDPGITKEIHQVFQNVSPMVTRRAYAVEWIRFLKKAGYKVLYLSNFGEITRTHCQDALEFMQYTDGGIMSYEVKLIKPDKAIYEALIEKYDLVPSECVFVDDLLANVEMAREVGMYAVQAVNHQTALDGLKALGVPSYLDS